MSGTEAIAFAVVLIGLGAAAFLVAQRPSFWIGFGIEAVKRLWPVVLLIWSKMKGLETPEQMQKRVREGRERGGKDR